MSEHIDKIKDAIVGGLHKDIEALVQAAVESGIAPELIVNEAGFSSCRRATETPFNLILEARP